MQTKRIYSRQARVSQDISGSGCWIRGNGRNRIRCQAELVAPYLWFLLTFWKATLLITLPQYIFPSIKSSSGDLMYGGRIANMVKISVDKNNFERPRPTPLASTHTHDYVFGCDDRGPELDPTACSLPMSHFKICLPWQKNPTIGPYSSHVHTCRAC